jgi:hypothetical protein
MNSQGDRRRPKTVDGNNADQSEIYKIDLDDERRSTDNSNITVGNFQRRLLLDIFNKAKNRPITVPITKATAVSSTVINAAFKNSGEVRIKSSIKAISSPPITAPYGRYDFSGRSCFIT